MKKIAIIGSHGIYANYGGWDQLVNNLAENKSKTVKYVIFNSRDTPSINVSLPNVKVIKSIFKASGFEGLFFDFFTTLRIFFFVDTILFLGVQGLPIIPFLKIFKKVNIICNCGGIEWERSKFGFLARFYLRFCFNLSLKHSKYLILDNEHFKKYIPEKINSRIVVIPYGGIIDQSLSIDLNNIVKFPFLKDNYYLTISRSIPDNMIYELLESFRISKLKLVLISNLSNSNYGQNILKEFKMFKNITIIDGLYQKPYLDLIRRNCFAYIHTHTKCGTAPSLVEMIIAGKPIISIDVPQNRYTLESEGFYFNKFSNLIENLNKITKIDDYKISKRVRSNYEWNKVVRLYENLY